RAGILVGGSLPVLQGFDAYVAAGHALDRDVAGDVVQEEPAVRADGERAGEAFGLLRAAVAIAHAPAVLLVLLAVGLLLVFVALVLLEGDDDAADDNRRDDGSCRGRGDWGLRQ